MEKTIKLNEQSMSKEEFENKKKELEEKPGVSVIKISENTYRTIIKG